MKEVGTDDCNFEYTPSVEMEKSARETEILCNAIYAALIVVALILLVVAGSKAERC
jgi:hypothetical protein